MSHCIEWSGRRDRYGYGRLKIGGKTVGAHRQAWIDCYGPIPDGLLVCHTCDNPPCVNVEHLWLGTHKQNHQDMVKKGRATQMQEGWWRQREGHIKLDPDKVREIRKLKQEGAVQARLAEQFGVHENTISAVVRGLIWRDVV